MFDSYNALLRIHSNILETWKAEAEHIFRCNSASCLQRVGACPNQLGVGWETIWMFPFDQIFIVNLPLHSIWPVPQPIWPVIQRRACYFIVVNTLVATTILGPVLYQLWIYNGSANANFFFAITLVFSTAQIFLVTDLLFAQVKREFYLLSGFKSIKSGCQNF